MGAEVKARPTGTLREHRGDFSYAVVLAGLSSFSQNALAQILADRR
jgi:hypothetical protein